MNIQQETRYLRNQKDTNMRRAYYYFLFRVYWYYRDRVKENDATAMFSVVAVSTLLLCFNFITIYFVVNYFNFVPIVTNEFHMVLFMVIVGCINYLFFIKGRKFLNDDFQKDRKGSVLIIAYIIFTFSLSLFVGQLNRERIFKEGKGEILNEPRKESLEEKVRKWFD